MRSSGLGGGSDAARTDSPWRVLGRHQVGAIVATLTDFAVMVTAVQALSWSPVEGTLAGATAGGVTNFALGRRWIFRGGSGALGGQAARYVMVSIASAGLNALGEHIAHDRAHVQYVVARALVAVAVSFAWNFPMQRSFVFRAAARSRARST
jgi:putative flippase GtrA